MSDPLLEHDELAAALRLIEREAEDYLAGIDNALVRPSGDPVIDGTLPAQGAGSLQALTELWEGGAGGPGRVPARSRQLTRA